MLAASWWKESQFRTPSLDSKKVGSPCEVGTCKSRHKRQREEVVELAVSVYVGVFYEEIQSGGWLTLTSPAPKRFNDAPFDKATKVEEEGQDG
jgi:hypothetical protein